MTDELGRRILNELAEIEETFKTQQRHRMGSVAAQVLDRASRRRNIKNLGVGVLSLAAAVTIVNVPAPNLADSESSTKTSAAGAARAVVPANEPATSHEGLGFWPEVRAEDSVEYCEDMNLQRPDSAAVHFANDLLEWSNVAIKDVDRVDDDHMRVTLGDLPSTYRGGSLPAHTEVVFGLTKIGQRDCWWMDSIWSPDSGARVRATVEDGTVRAEFDLPAGVERADVVVVEADSAGRDFVLGDPGRTTAQVEDFEGPGYLVVLWKGEDGSTAWAAGVTLPEGDSSNTSP